MEQPASFLTGRVLDEQHPYAMFIRGLDPSSFLARSGL